MKDRFSEQAGSYAAYRPVYPKALYEFIFSKVKHFDLAWDAGTGNGQAARELARVFRKVLATDISSSQLEHAERLPNIEYDVAAEVTTLPDSCVNLITVAQAIHWFDRKRLYEEVRRVAAPGAVLAVWGYGLVKFNSALDPLLWDFYRKTVGPYWDKERRHIDDRFGKIEFPFEEFASPFFQIEVRWTLSDFKGYLSTWSAVRNFIAETGFDPVPAFAEQLARIWSKETEVGIFDIFMRIGRVSKA